MKILLVSIPLEFPLANYCLAAQLAASRETAVCEVVLLHLNSSRLNSYNRKSTEIWRYIARVEAERPDVIAFSVYLWSNLATTELIAITAKLYPEIAIVVGGPEIATPEAATPWVARGTVAAAVRGEGELTMVELVARLANGDGAAGVEGCSWYDGTSVVHEPKRAPARDLSVLASPFLNGFVPDDLFAHADSDQKATFPRGLIETYRGCYMQCSYCQWGNGSKSRSSLPEDRVRKELTWLLSRNIEALWIVDAMFGFKKQLAKDILVHICGEKRRFGATTKIVCYHNQDYYDPELFELYRKADVSVEVDLQSVDKGVLTQVGRAKWYTDSFDRHLAAFREQGVPTTGAADLIIGLPRDRLASFTRSVDFLLERGMNVNLYQTSIIPDTPMSRSIEADGTVFSDIAPRAVFRNCTFSTQEMVTARLMGHGVDFFARYPKVAQLLWRRGFTRPSEFCQRLGQLLWDEHELMYGESHTNDAVLADAQALLLDILPQLCADEWLLPVVRDVFRIEAAASLMVRPPENTAAPPVLRRRAECYAADDRWLAERPRFRREAVASVPIRHRVDRQLKVWTQTGQMPPDPVWKDLPVDPAVALVYLAARRSPSYRVVDAEVTHALLERFTGHFSVAECLDNVVGGAWRGEDLSPIRDTLSGLACAGFIEIGTA